MGEVPPQAGAKIKELGWRQGSILPNALCEELTRGGVLGVSIEAGAVLIVVSHDCDVTNASLVNEPSVELLLGRLRSGGSSDGSLLHGRNPRRLQIPILVSGATQYVEARAFDRFWVPRERLLGHEPDSGRACPRPALDDVVAWLVKRYNRAAFPDAFNERISKVHRHIARALAANGRDILAVYAGMSSWDEFRGVTAHGLGGQMIVSTHGASLLDLDLLQRDRSGWWQGPTRARAT